MGLPRLGPVDTQENATPGTPAFMAPEQAAGTDFDGRADIYSTGCLAYWLLTGQFVFTSQTPVGHLFHHAHTPPTPPSARTEKRVVISTRTGVHGRRRGSISR
jgi:serine/threonine protein kinase